MRAIPFAIFFLAFASLAGADDQLTLEQKREWLRDRIAATSRDRNARADAAARVARLNDNQLDALFDYYRSGKADADQRQAEDLDRKHDLDRVQRAAAARAFLQQRAAANARSGYAPVITTLPSGAALSAGGVISPDGRYVRVNATPFFSSVPGFYTFNMANGQTQYYPTQQDPYGYGTLPNSPLVPSGATSIQQPALQGVIPRPALEGYIPRPALQPRP